MCCHVTFSVSVPGFRTKKVTVATTLLDPKKYPANAFAELYRHRWRAEVWLGHLKTNMGMEILRCKTPQMIGKKSGRASQRPAECDSRRLNLISTLWEPRHPAGQCPLRSTRKSWCANGF